MPTIGVVTHSLGAEDMYTYVLSRVSGLHGDFDMVSLV